MVRSKTEARARIVFALVLFATSLPSSGCVFVPPLQKAWKPPFSASTLVIRRASSRGKEIELQVEGFDQDFSLGGDPIRVDTAALFCSDVDILAHSTSGVVSVPVDEPITMRVIESDGPGMCPSPVPDCALLLAARLDTEPDPHATVIQVWDSSGLFAIHPVNGLTGRRGSKLWLLLYPFAVVGDLTIGATIAAGVAILESPELLDDIVKAKAR